MDFLVCSVGLQIILHWYLFYYCETSPLLKKKKKPSLLSCTWTLEFFSILNRNETKAPTDRCGSVCWVSSLKWEVTVSFSGQGACMGCRFSPSWCISGSGWMFLCSFFSLPNPLPKKIINKKKLKEGIKKPLWKLEWVTFVDYCDN